MEDLKDIILGTNLIWEGNLEDSDDTRVKIYFKVIDLDYIDNIYKISVEIEKISALRMDTDTILIISVIQEKI